MTKQQRLILVTAILASLVAFLDSAVVNVALPVIRAELGGGLAAQQWIVDAYLITLGSLILVAGSISDLFGRKRVLFGGLIGFAISSVLCAAAPNASFLIAARGLQGIAGALLVPSSLALIISAFSEAAQGKAIGTWTAWTGIAFIIGPLLGGFLVDAASWRLVFAINIIPIALTLWLLSRITHQDEHRQGASIDFIGAFLTAAGLGATVFALIEQPNHGWNSPLIYLSLIGGLALLGAFVLFEQRIRHPMLPLKLFKHHNFSVGNIATFAIYAGLSAITFTLVLFVQQVGHYSAFASGFTLIPITLILFFLSSRTGHLAGKYGPRWFMAIGPGIMAVAMLMLAFAITTEVRYFAQLLPGIIVFGLGLAITVAPLTAAILGDVEKEYAGIASAVNNAVSRIAGLIAIAAIGAIIAAQFGTSLDRRLSQKSLDQSTQNFITGAKTKPLDVTVPPNLNPNDQKIFQQAQYVASVSAFKSAAISVAILLLIGGGISAFSIRNPARLKSAQRGTA